MSKKIKQRCPCGSGKGLRQCCGRPSSEKKLELEKAARHFSDLGMYSEACEVLEKRTSLSPENPLIWNDLGVQRVAAGQPSEAVMAFKQALEVFPEYPVALYNLGKLSLDRCLEELRLRGQQMQDDQIIGSATEAAKYLQASVAQDPSLARAHKLLHKVYGILGDRQKASFHLAKALKLDPDLRTFYDWPRLERLPLIGRLFNKLDNRGPDFLSSLDYRGPNFPSRR
jgi:Flp pilus assembly protein TadD